MSRSWTTISCRAFALCAVLLGSFAARSAAADKPPPPGLPITTFWSVELGVEASAPPVSDGDRVFVALKTAVLTARSAADGHELWRIPKDVSVPMAADAGLVFVSAGDAIEAIRGQDGASAWVVPRVKTVAPLVSHAGWVIAVTDAEILAIHATDGQVVWRHPAGGVKLAPAIDGDRLYAGAVDGRVLALALATGAVVWDDKYLPLGVSNLAARAGRVYAGAGDKQFYCLDGRSGKTLWPKFIGAIPTGPIAVDGERVYFTALNNIVYALDRANGNQRWTSPLRRRAIGGVIAAGHVIFVPGVAAEISMLYDYDGHPSGVVPLKADIPRDLPPDIRQTPAGLHVFAISGGLTNEWYLTFIAPVDEAPLVPLSTIEALPGLPFLTDPVLEPMWRVLGPLIFGDPPLRPASTLDFPLVLRDPPLEPLTVFPGVQLRPLSPVLPTRRGG